MNASLLRTGGEIAEIYMKHVDTVYRVALTLMKNIPEAEDATQAVFIKFMTAEKSFDSDEHIKAWLIVTTRNVCLDLLRSWWRTRRVDIESVTEQEDRTEFPDNEVWQAISNLDEKHKLPLYLHYYEGYKTEEIAGMLGINHATIRTRLRAAKKKLRLILEKEEDDYANK